MSVYVLSDTHFGHSNILKWRSQFSTVEEHDEYILDNILSICGKRDSLYILGDVCLGKDSLRYVVEIANNIDHLHIVLGNHDDERTGAPTVRDYLFYCKNVYGIKKYKNAWLTHAPIHPEELRGKINVHGHIHAGYMKTPEGWSDDNYVNVSCENTKYKPINMVDIFGGWRGV